MTRTEIDLAWPDQIRLPGQTAAHPGPVDMTMMWPLLMERIDDGGRAVLRAMEDEHAEIEAIAIIQQVMTAEDWERLEEEVFREGVSFRQVVALVPWVLHEVPRPVRRQLFAQPGGWTHRLIWRVTRRGFERRDRVAFRHLA